MITAEAGTLSIKNNKSLGGAIIVEVGLSAILNGVTKITLTTTIPSAIASGHCDHDPWTTGGMILSSSCIKNCPSIICSSIDKLSLGAESAFIVEPSSNTTSVLI